jgi:bifunctional DNA-binding transcriptional regulator/antitoxin component of YhaV-PrlF toxin-antitoxin module
MRTDQEEFGTSEGAFGRMKKTKRLLLSTSAVGAKGQTVVPAKIRKLFKLDKKIFQLGWFMNGCRIEVAPVVEKSVGYSTEELGKLEKLSDAKGGHVFKNVQSSQAYLFSLS